MMCTRLMASLMADETLLISEVFKALFLHELNCINIHGIQIFDAGDVRWRCIVRDVGTLVLISDGLSTVILSV